jgi:hypothetical protein
MSLPAPLQTLPAPLTHRMVPVGYHGPDMDPVARGRYVVDGAEQWPASRPEVCPNVSDAGVWLADGWVLVCPTCGLDQT